MRAENCIKIERSNVYRNGELL